MSLSRQQWTATSRPRWHAHAGSQRAKRLPLAAPRRLVALLLLQLLAVEGAPAAKAQEGRTDNRTDAGVSTDGGSGEKRFSRPAIEPVYRRLANLDPIGGWQWPNDLQLTLQHTLTDGNSLFDVSAKNTPPAMEVVLLASGCRHPDDDGPPVFYNRIRIQAPDSTFTSQHENAAIRLVKFPSALTSASRYQCYLQELQVPVGLASRAHFAGGALVASERGDLGLTNAQLLVPRLNPAGDDDTLEASSKIVFMWGGIYHLCYTADGSFDEASNFKENVVNVQLRILGVKSPCRATPDSSTEADGCIEDERWDCFFSQEGHGSVQNCEFNFKDDGARSGWSVTAGDRSKITWSDAYGVDTIDGNGQYSGSLPTDPKWCGISSPDTADIFDQETSGVFRDAGVNTAGVMPAVKSAQSEAFTVSACYCPSYDLETGTPCLGDTGAVADRCCEKAEEYIQMVGKVYYWTIRICDMDNYDGVRTGPTDPAGCYSPYRRVLPQQKFVLRIECPPGGGCESQGFNLIKYVDVTADSDLPSWKETHPCKVTAESASAVWPTESASESLSGGLRVDYKVWADQPVKINKSVKRTIDVCYSNSNSPTYFFKVGTIQTAEAFAIASKYSGHAERKTVKYAGSEGSFTLYSGIRGEDPSPYDGNPFSGKAMTYFMSYDREMLWGSGAGMNTLEGFLGFDQAMPHDAQTQLDVQCQRFRPSLDLISSNPLPLAEVTDSPDDRYHTFSGSGQNQYVTVNLAGIVAVCYCAIISDSNQCEIPTNWIYAGRFTIQGPFGLNKKWLFDIDIVVKLDVLGWGLSSDNRLRIIPNENECSDNSGNPPGASGFKVGCPSPDATNCVAAGSSTDIMLKAFSGPGLDKIDAEHAITIIAAYPADDHTILEFDNARPIHDLIHEDDIITIEYDSVIINDQAKTDETPQDKYDLYQFTGEYDFQDSLEPGEELEKYQIGHKVKRTYTTNGDLEPYKLSIPIGWAVDVRPTFAFPAVGDQLGGRWMVRSRVETAEEVRGLTATLPNLDLKVCWGVTSAGVTTYYQQAGELQFMTPPTMSQAAVYMTTKQAEAIAPTVIYFRTNPAQTKYASTTGKTKLVIRFLDASTEDGKLVPHYASDHRPTCPNGGCPLMPDPDDEVLQRNSRQYLCGRFFSELWSSDSEGFPVPQGCFFSQRLRDAGNPDGSNDNNFYREVSLVFNSRTGLKANTKYMLVMNAMNPTALDTTAAPLPVVDIISMCAEDEGCERPYMVIEKSTGKIDRPTLAPLSAQNNPRLATGGFNIESPNDDGLLSLSEMNIISVRITGGPGLRMIRPQAILRMYMMPLTLWNVGQAPCTAECVPFEENSAAQCSGNVGCDPEAIIDTAYHNEYNAIKLTLPSDMTDITDVTTHTVKVKSLTLPKGGFFPTRVGVQLTKEDDSDPSFTTSNGMIWKDAEAGRTEGRLVLTGPTGSGTKPFAGDDENKLVVRIRFGATMWNWGGAELNAMFEIKLPLGYTCRVVGQGEPPVDMPVFNADSNGDNYPDNSRGLLAVNTDDGNWERSLERSCFYELARYNRIYESQVVYIELQVTNPTIPLRKDILDNNWEINLFSKGANENDLNPAGREMPSTLFTNDSTIATNDEAAKYFQGNAAVIQELVMPLFQPGTSLGSMTRSCCGATFDQRTSSQYMRVFFKPGVAVGQRGYVIVDAPPGFDFDATCDVADLPSEYHAYAGEGEFELRLLKEPRSCEGRRYPATSTTYNRASIQVGGLIDLVDLVLYGFSVRVTAPTTYSTSQQEEWRLWLQDSNGFPLEGSKETVKFNPLQSPTQTLFYHKSWGLYDQTLEGIRINIADLRPYSISSSLDSDITIWPIVFPEAVQTSLRITAPVGFEWNTDNSNYMSMVNCEELLPCRDFGGQSAIPANRVVANQLIFSSVYFDPDIRYGFRHKIRIPDKNPRTSSNTFYFEFGFQEDDISDRKFAVAIESPMVAAIINAKVDFNTNQVGITDNYIQFKFQTQTQVVTNGGVVITGNLNTRGFTFVNEYLMLPDSDPFPDDLTITATREADGTPKIILKVQQTPLPRGYYQFEMRASNPETRILVAGEWYFESHSDVSLFPTPTYLDNRMKTPGFVISSSMPFAGFYALNEAEKTLTSRKDRPNYANNVVITFELRSLPEETHDMVLKAPHGFVFEDDCLGPPEARRLVTDRNMVFGDNTGGTWPSDLEEWKSNVEPISCKGSEREARITIPIGLQVLQRYAFRIGVINPRSSPSWNKWTLNFNSESSDPFQGFNIWTALGTPTIEPVSKARNPGGSADPIVNPVTVRWRPYKTVPSKPTNADKGGVLRIEAPLGFLFVHRNLECEVDLRVTGASAAAPARDLLCEVDTSETRMNLYMVGNTEITGEESGVGNEYQLIIYIYNPIGADAPGLWHLNSFSRETREPEYTLDETQITGYAIHSDFWKFSVTNMLQEYNGDKPVTDVKVIMAFFDNVQDGHTIKLYAPRGFNIVNNPELSTCENFRTPPGGSPFPTTGQPECYCEEVTNGPLCRLEWADIKEGKDPAYAQRQDIVFTIGTRNPPKTPFITDNFWHVEHLSGSSSLLASQIDRSWDINPQLANVVVGFANGYFSAGSEATLAITFTPVNDAFVLVLEAEFPTEFDFSQAQVFAYDILSNEGPRLEVLVRQGMIADQEFSMEIHNVRLGRGGGQTTWNLVTYYDQEKTLKRDERLAFSEGAFRLPGKVVMLSQPQLTSAWTESRLLYPVKSLFKPRVGEWATAEFRISFSQAVYSQGKLMITSQGAGDDEGYTLRTDGFVIIGTAQIESVPVLDATGKSIQATLKANRPASEVALLADTRYTISLRVYPHTNGLNTWRFDTTDSREGFTNTDDGESPGFSPVLNYLVTVGVQRSPPRAVIEVTLTVEEQGSVVRELLIYAPPGFTFDEGANGCGDMCVPGQPLGTTGRMTATIAAPTGEPLTKLEGLRIRVRTPEQTPIGSGSEGILWFVEGRGQTGSDSTLGWGQGSGFAVTQMSGTAVYYAGVANSRSTEMAFTFSLDVDAGSSISVVPPAGFLLTCSVEGSLSQISLPGGRPNCIDDPLQLQLQQPLTRGTYSFAITADLPPQTPEVNTFNIMIQDQYNKVVDAAYSVIGEEIVNIGVEKPTLSWSRADPGQPTMITVGVTFTEDVSSLKAMLIVLPEKFQHDVQIPIDVQNLNSRFPLASGNDWADTTEVDRIKIFLDDSEDTTTIPADTYRFSFPALMPPDVPARNVWFFALCSDRGCRQPSDREVLISFPVAGFALYEIAPAALRMQTSRTVGRSVPHFGAAALIGLSAFLALRRF